jgi:septal ring-binding cell division protein DamX
MISKFILIMCIITVHVGSAFALPDKPCAHMNAEQMEMMDMAMPEMPDSKVDVGASMDASADCCDKECSCATGISTSAMAIDSFGIKINLNPSSRIHFSGQGDIDIALSQPQRPPKH